MTEIVRWLVNHGFRIVAIDTAKRRITIEIPEGR